MWYFALLRKVHGRSFQTRTCSDTGTFASADEVRSHVRICRVDRAASHDDFRRFPPLSRRSGSHDPDPLCHARNCCQAADFQGDLCKHAALHVGNVKRACNGTPLHRRAHRSESTARNSIGQNATPRYVNNGPEVGTPAEDSEHAAERANE